jgi:opacity protein-like surface antigen
MNIKSLLLGSAAALVAATGAQAADAVVVADPEPVEYVRVCDVYGTGYFYIPGTETCLRIGGYVRYQASGGDLFARQVTDHTDGDINDTYNQYARLSLQTWTGTETELGTLKTYTETRFEYGNSGTDTIGLDAVGDPVGYIDRRFGTSTSLNFAWIELGGFRVGKDESAFTTFLGYAGNVIADDLIGNGPYDTNLISYTFTSGAFSAIIAAESGGTGDFDGFVEQADGTFVRQHDYGIDSYMPHVVAGVKYTAGWGGLGIVGGYDANHEKFAVKARLDVTVNETFSGFLMGGWGEDDLEVDGHTGLLGSFNYYKPWGGEWAVWGGLTAAVSEKAKVNLQVAYDDSETLAASLNVNYELVPGFVITPEIDYVDADGDDNFGGIIRFQRNF